MADSVSVDDVRHVAMLARLGISDARAAELTRELNTILEHMSVLSRVHTEGVAEAPSVGLSAMPLRPDDGPAIPLAERPEAFAPEMRAGFFIVPRLATHEDAEESA